METFTLSAFGRSQGVSPEAVSKACRTGRLRQSIQRDAKGRPRIVDFALAKREWTENARQPRRRARTDDLDLSPLSKISLTDAQRALTLERTRKLRLERDVTEGRLIQKTLAAKEAFEADRTIRENVLNLPARIAGELAAETDAAKVYLRLDAALREALNVTADGYLAHTSDDTA